MKKVFSLFFPAILFFMPIFVAHANTTTGLIGWWKFNEGTGTTAYDSSGSGYNASTTGSPVYVAGKIGPFALTFNGSSQYVSHSNIGAFNFGTGDFTVSFWMNPASPWGTGTTVGVIGQKASDSTNGWQIYQDSGHAGYLDARVGLNNNFLTASAISTGVWTFVTLTRQGTTMSWYINGALSTTTANSVTVSDATIPFYIGYGPTWTAYYTGSLDDVRVYNRALTSGDISELYAYNADFGTPEEMSSQSYAIAADSINFAGDYSTSTSYSLQDTVGEIATGNSTSTSYSLNAGYQQMYSPYIALGSLSPVSLGSISGLGGSTATGSLSMVVTTDNPAGYSLIVQATSSPALSDPAGASFADYSSVSSTTPDYSFSIASNTSAFGFSVQGTDALGQYLNNGSACNTGSLNTAFKCWDNFTTSQKIIAQAIGPNTPGGATTTLDLEAQIGSAKIQDAGAYSATIIVTAVTL